MLRVRSEAPRRAAAQPLATSTPPPPPPQQQHATGDRRGSQQDPLQAITAALGRLPRLETMMAEMGPISEQTDDAADLPELDALTAVQEQGLSRAREVRAAVQGARVAAHADDFNAEVQPAVVMMGSMPVQALRQRELELHTQRVSAETRMIEAVQARYREVGSREHAAKAAVLRETTDLRAALAASRHEHRAQTQIDEIQLQRAFHHAETEILARVRDQRADIQAVYGAPVLVGSLLSRQPVRKWTVAWDAAPQPIQLRLAGIGGAAQNLPSGSYVVSVALQDRLGGQRLGWHALHDLPWDGVAHPTSPVAHSGAPFLTINQSLVAACPPVRACPPGAVLVFQVSRLTAGASSLGDVPAAWGVLPLCHPNNGSLVSGKFRIPLLRGAIRRRFSRFEQIDDALAENLEAWGGNLYFELLLMPRTLNGLAEDVVKLSWVHSSEVPLVPGGKAVQTLTAQTLSAQPQAPSDEDVVAPGRTADNEGISALSAPAVAAATADVAPPSAGSKRRHDEWQLYSAVLPRAADGSVGHFDVPVDAETMGSRLTYLAASLRYEFGMGAVRPNECLWTLFFVLVMFWVRIWLHYTGQYLILKELNVPVTNFHVQAASCAVIYETTYLLANEVVAIVAAGPLFVFLFFLVLAFVQYVDSLVHKADFPRVFSLLTSVTGVYALLDPLLIFIVDLCYGRWSNGTPRKAAGDAFKLYWHYNTQEGNGLPGVFLVLFVYACTTLLVWMVLSHYLWFAHLNGCWRDWYLRAIHREADVHVPFDSEVSASALLAAATDAAAWQGDDASMRRVVVVIEYAGNHKNPTASASQPVIAHVSICTVTGRAATIFRHFLRLPHGAIVELPTAASARTDTVSNMGGCSDDDDPWGMLTQLLKLYNVPSALQLEERAAQQACS